MISSVTWKIGGEAGFGIMSSGIMLSKIFSRLGYSIFATNEYPSLIRGGHNLITLRISTEKINAMHREVHILVALNKDTVTLHKDELSEGAIVLFDPTNYAWQATELPASVKLLPVPLTDLMKALNGDQVMRNTVALGATLALLGADFSVLENMLKDQFARKGEAVVALNVSIAKAGYDYVKEHYSGEQSVHLAPATSREKQLVINGSEALGVGAVRAGLKFAAIYPMTPINSLISYLADHEKQLKLVYMQPEDEIAGMNMALGASLMGVRSMVATSGGGFALMVEGVSLAGIMELPIVIDLGMRVGPATGMPTWTEQGELQLAIHAGHGEFPRIVMAPADAEEAYKFAVEAFNLADRYQIPVFLLTDKYLNESHWCVPYEAMAGPVTIDRGKLMLGKPLPEDGSFKRYDLNVDDGVSARSVPGMKHGFFISNSYEHDEVGLVTEDPEGRSKMVEKRLKKFVAMEKEVKPPTLHGPADADITLVCWGTTRGPVLEAMRLLEAKGKKVNCLHYSWIFPFPVKGSTDVLSKSKRIMLIEQNATGQLGSLIREHTGIHIEERFLKYNGRPFWPEEIVERVSAS